MNWNTKILGWTTDSHKKTDDVICEHLDSIYKYSKVHVTVIGYENWAQVDELIFINKGYFDKNWNPGDSHHEELSIGDHILDVFVKMFKSQPGHFTDENVDRNVEFESIPYVRENYCPTYHDFLKVSLRSKFGKVITKLSWF